MRGHKGNLAVLNVCRGFIQVRHCSRSVYIPIIKFISTWLQYFLGKFEPHFRAVAFPLQSKNPCQ